MSRISFQPLRVALLTLLILSPSAASAQKHDPIDTGPGSVTEARRYLQGTWALISFDLFPAGKPMVHVADGQGQLTYDDFGNLTMDLNIPGPFVDQLRLAGVPSDNGVIHMKGSVEINMEAKTLTYFFNFDKPPQFGEPTGPLALDRPRHWAVDGDTLTLTTKGDDGKPVSVVKWRKVP